MLSPQGFYACSTESLRTQDGFSAAYVIQLMGNLVTEKTVSMWDSGSESEMVCASSTCMSLSLSLDRSLALLLDDNRHSP